MVEVSARPAPDTEATSLGAEHGTRDSSTEKSSGGSTLEREAMGKATSGVGTTGSSEGIWGATRAVSTGGSNAVTASHLSTTASTALSTYVQSVLIATSTYSTSSRVDVTLQIVTRVERGLPTEAFVSRTRRRTGESTEPGA